MSIAEAVEQFPKLLTAGSYRVNAKLDTALRAIDKAKAIRFDKPGQRWESLRQRQAQVLNALSHRYMEARLSEHYPILDNAIFDMKRYICVKHNGGDRYRFEGTIVKDQRQPFADMPKADGYKRLSYAECGLFAVANLDLRNVSVHADVGEFRHGRNEYHLRANMPGIIGDDVLSHCNRAKSRYYGILADIFKIDKLADCITAENDTFWHSKEAPHFQLIWIPTTQSIYVDKATIAPPADPALILTYNENRVTGEGTRFLIHMWNVEEELPMEHIIREFSLGAMPAPLDE